MKVGGENCESKKKVGKKEWKACRNKKERKDGVTKQVNGHKIHES